MTCTIYILAPIHETTEYLEAFLRNLLLNEKNELHNRNLHISGLLNEEKVDIGDTKVDIENGKVDFSKNGLYVYNGIRYNIVNGWAYRI